jgi:hypothetical protein
MKTQKANKKFDLEKFEVAKLKNLKGINGGQNGDVTTIDDPKTITDTIGQANSKNC